MASALRRALLSDLTSFAITGTRINNLPHEFDVVDGLKDDVLEVLLNLKEMCQFTKVLISFITLITLSITLFMIRCFLPFI